MSEDGKLSDLERLTDGINIIYVLLAELRLELNATPSYQANPKEFLCRPCMVHSRQLRDDQG